MNHDKIIENWFIFRNMKSTWEVYVYYTVDITQGSIYALVWSIKHYKK